MNSKIDKGLEFFGFGGPKDKESKFDDLFGEITYYKDGNYWWAKQFWHPGDSFYKYDNRVVWGGTYIYHPITSGFRTVASKFKYATSNKKNFELLLKFMAETINSVEEKVNVFNATCNIDDIVAGKDPRFVFVYLDVTHDQYLKKDVCIMATAFNKRIFYTFFTEDYRLFCFVPEDPSLLRLDMMVKKLDAKIKKPDLRRMESIQIGKEGFFSSYTETRKLLEEEISNYIEGEYDTEDTDVTVNSPNPDDSNTDVDIRIDMTPEREQVLLKAFQYNTKEELNVYGIEGLSFKASKINDSFEDLFTTLYTDHKENVNKVSSLVDDNVKLAIPYIETDITSKEQFIDNIRDASTSVFNNFKMLKSLVESSSIQASNSVNPNYFSLSEETTFANQANFINKADITFISNELTKTKVHVNLSQIKLYTNKLIEKMKTTEYTDAEHEVISNTLNTLNLSMINLANYISQGKRFIDEVVIKCS